MNTSIHEISDSKSVLTYKCVDGVTAVWFIYNNIEGSREINGTIVSMLNEYNL